MSLFAVIICLTTLTCVELLYFKIADYFNIVDKPNERSSHTKITIRGGGVVFPIAVLLFFFSQELAYPYFTLGLLAIALVSFLDDVLTLNNKLRLLIHVPAVLLLFFQLQIFFLPWYIILVALVFSIAALNAYNFMDGINGITGAYSLITLCTLGYINHTQKAFVNQNLLIVCVLSLLVFNFFNYRFKAKCFAGDVGSVSIAFIIIFVVGLLIIQTQNIAYILLLLLYGLDTTTTIIFRRVRNENIFKAHQSHFYQFLTSRLKWPHLLVAALYALTQTGINVLLLRMVNKSEVVFLFFVGFAVFFICLRFIVEGKTRLLVRNQEN